jgi:hypothetical protein
VHRSMLLPAAVAQDRVGRPRNRSRSVLAVATAVAVLGGQSASAKTGAEAHLLGLLPLHSRTGMLVTVRWTVDVPGVGGRRAPFGAVGMFATLVGARGAVATATARQSQGSYSVRIRVPVGGIQGIRIGLLGFAMEADGSRRPAPVLFPITNNPFSGQP